MSAPQQILAAGHGGDPADPNIVLLLRGETSSSLGGGSISPDDSSQYGRVAQTGTGIDLSATWFKHGTKSIHMNNTDGQFRYAGTTATQLSGDFTIETWVRFTGFGVGPPCFIYGNGPGPQGGLFVNPTNSNKIEYAITTRSASDIIGQVMLINTDYHVAARRIGSTVELFVNDVSQGTCTDTTTYFQQYPGTGSTQDYAIHIMHVLDGGGAMNGYIDDFCVTKGVGRGPGLWYATFAT